MLMAVSVPVNVKCECAASGGYLTITHISPNHSSLGPESIALANPNFYMSPNTSPKLLPKQYNTNTNQNSNSSPKLMPKPRTLTLTL